jgi:hypothetical protein
VRNGLIRGKLHGVGRALSGRNGVDHELVEVSHRCNGELAGQVLEAGSFLREACVVVDILLVMDVSFLFEGHLASEGGGGGLRVYGRDECLGWSLFGLGAQLSGFDDIVNVARVIGLLPSSVVGCPVSVDDKLQRGVVRRARLVPKVVVLTL